MTFKLGDRVCSTNGDEFGSGVITAEIRPYGRYTERVTVHGPHGQTVCSTGGPVHPKDANDVRVRWDHQLDTETWVHPDDIRLD